MGRKIWAAQLKRPGKRAIPMCGWKGCKKISAARGVGASEPIDFCLEHTREYGRLCGWGDLSDAQQALLNVADSKFTPRPRYIAQSASVCISAERMAAARETLDQFLEGLSK